MRYRVTHTTTYAYEELVSICHNEMRLEPRSALHQQCLATALAIDPMPAVLTTALDDLLAALPPGVEVRHVFRLRKGLAARASASDVRAVAKVAGVTSVEADQAVQASS